MGKKKGNAFQGIVLLILGIFLLMAGLLVPQFVGVTCDGLNMFNPFCHLSGMLSSFVISTAATFMLFMGAIVMIIAIIRVLI